MTGDGGAVATGPDSNPDRGPSEDDPRRRLADALRPLIDLTVAAVLEDDEIEAAADAVEAVSARLARHVGPGKRVRQQPDITRPPQEFFPTSPVMGIINPIAPPVRLSVVDGIDGGYREIRAEANFGYAYEGPPTCLHGGVIAEVFDEVLGAANMVAGNPAMTGTLTVRYRKPTPLRTDLRIEARCLGRDGRKIRTWAAMYHEDLLTAEAEGIFIEVGPERFVAIAEGNMDSADPVMLEAMRAEAARPGAASDVPGWRTGPDPNPNPNQR
jgi:acyl-coenzyme A thioesterase PaaI-like protein